MPHKAVPMTRVVDVRSTIAWYQSVGFTLQRTFEDDGDMNWALLTFGTSEVMFATGCNPLAPTGRDVDLYVHVEAVDALYLELKDRVDVTMEPTDVFHGMREFIVRDPNGFTVVFAEPIA